MGSFTWAEMALSCPFLAVTYWQLATWPNWKSQSVWLNTYDIYCMCVCARMYVCVHAGVMCMPRCICGGQRTTGGPCFSPYRPWVSDSCWQPWLWAALPAEPSCQPSVRFVFNVSSPLRQISYLHSPLWAQSLGVERVSLFILPMSAKKHLFLLYY